MTPPRVVLIVLDSVGIGELPDAPAYGDEGSNTVGNLDRAVPLTVATLRSLGLPHLVDVGGERPPPRGAYGRLAEASPGKDSVTGHWELAGLVLDKAFPTFPQGFPADVIGAFERRIGRPILGNVAASGIAILDRLGPEHMRTGAPIVYTSADSVFQVAAHEAVVPLDQLYGWCGSAYALVVRGIGVGRVIARPFIGAPGAFVRTANRRDFSLEPAGATVLDRLKDAGCPVVGIGKIGDLFAGRGFTDTHPAASDDDGLNRLEDVLAQERVGLIAINLVDFDSRYGHRNDVAGYASHLEHVDRRLGRIVDRLQARDVVVITADHGNDPTTPSTDHSREYVPIFVVGPMIRAGIDLGTRSTFADLGQTLCEWFDVPPVAHGTSFLAALLR